MPRRRAAFSRWAEFLVPAAGGDLDYRPEVPNSEEMGRLAEAMNEVAARLDERMRTVVSQRNEREAILASMAEGVLEGSQLRTCHEY